MTAIELAAVASAAVPGLNVKAFGPEPDDASDFSSALLVDADGRRWRVRSPLHAEASTRLETERQVLRAFSPAVRAELPFLLPTVAGTVRQGELITFVYSHIAGKAEPVEELSAGGAALALEVGTAIAAIHDLPQELVTNANLPSYTANEFRQRKLNELDQAAATGKIPASLLRRWEHAMEDVPLWRFNPSVVHGDLHEDNILLEGSRVTAVMGWTDLRVGDPADDFAWLVAINDPDFVDTVIQAYSAARRERPDPHLLRRAALSAEFALAQWLVKGFATDSARIVAEAESMLATLKSDIDAHGGQPISTEPAPAVSQSGATRAAAPVPNKTPESAAATEGAAAGDDAEPPTADPDATGAIPLVGVVMDDVRTGGTAASDSAAGDSAADDSAAGGADEADAETEGPAGENASDEATRGGAGARAAGSENVKTTNLKVVRPED